MMSLGAGALKVSGGPNASSGEKVSMATLEAGTTLEQPLTGTVTLIEFSGDTIFIPLNAVAFIKFFVIQGRRLYEGGVYLKSNLFLANKSMVHLNI